MIVLCCVQSCRQLALGHFLLERLKDELIFLQGRRYEYLICMFCFTICALFG
jgi:hypothetical protein